MVSREINENFTVNEADKLLSCKPGLTGNWAASGRSNVTFDSGDRQRMELEYVDKCNMWFDIKLILRTVKVVFVHNGVR